MITHVKECSHIWKDANVYVKEIKYLYEMMHIFMIGCKWISINIGDMMEIITNLMINGYVSLIKFSPTINH